MTSFSRGKEQEYANNFPHPNLKVNRHLYGVTLICICPYIYLYL